MRQRKKLGMEWGYRTWKRSDRAWRWEWRPVYPTWCSGKASPPQSMIYLRNLTPQQRASIQLF